MIRYLQSIRRTVHLFLASMVVCSGVQAQKDCEGMLSRARVDYHLGRFNETINSIASHYDCLQGDTLSNGQKIEAYKFLAVSYIVLDYPDSAQERVDSLLEIDPEYKPAPDENLPLVFKQMLADTSRRVRAYKSRALAFIREGDHDSARGAIIMIFQLDPRFEPDRNDPEEFKEIVEDKQIKVSAYKSRALSLIERGDTVAAKETIILIYMTDPEFMPGPEDRLLFARKDLRNEARRRQAIALLNSSLKSSPKDSAQSRSAAQQSIADLLRFDSTYTASADDDSLYQELVNEEREKIGVTSTFPWFWVGGGIVAGGIVAAILINKADEAVQPKPLPLPPGFPRP